MWQEVNQYSEVQLCQIWTSVKVLNISEAVLFLALRVSITFVADSSVAHISITSELANVRYCCTFSQRIKLS